MLSVDEVIKKIPMEFTLEDLKVLKANKDIAIKKIDGCIEECNNSISKAAASGDSNKMGLIPYFESCKERLSDVKGAL
ncbi:hypothetical protein COA01_21840 [Bacillus cereus]|uniref:hypothetical protein n=1 Tax=Bacillus cereus TaxID=1396 RepID=UPI000BFC2793|nr:hypothetical protein [Bacillus cereus]PGP19210.1 hypothetical protein COA01_21840 [Bacillus cereus]